jgi:hypothetical protein
VLRACGGKQLGGQARDAAGFRDVRVRDRDAAHAGHRLVERCSRRVPGEEQRDERLARRPRSPRMAMATIAPAGSRAVSSTSSTRSSPAASARFKAPMSAPSSWAWSKR